MKVERTITIKAPVESVFAYLLDPSNLPEIWPSLIEVKDVKQTPAHVGDTFNWVYKMAGMHFEGSTATAEYVANARLVTRSTGGIPSEFIWTYTPEDGQTRLGLEIEYTIPMPLLGKLAEAFVVKLNEREADTLLANLKERMES